MSSKCGQCQAIMINGVYCHETGCPNQHLDTIRQCLWCGHEFTVTDNYGIDFCSVDCNEDYHS